MFAIKIQRPKNTHWSWEVGEGGSREGDRGPSPPGAAEKGKQLEASKKGFLRGKRRKEHEGSPFPRHTLFLTERLLGESLVLGARAVIFRGTWQTPRALVTMLCHKLPKSSGLKAANFSHRTQFLWIGTRKWLSRVVRARGV